MNGSGLARQIEDPTQPVGLIVACGVHAYDPETVPHRLCRLRITTKHKTPHTGQLNQRSGAKKLCLPGHGIHALAKPHRPESAINGSQILADVA